MLSELKRSRLEQLRRQQDAGVLTEAERAELIVDHFQPRWQGGPFQGALVRLLRRL